MTSDLSSIQPDRLIKHIFFAPQFRCDSGVVIDQNSDFFDICSENAIDAKTRKRPATISKKITVNKIDKRMMKLLK